MRARVLIAAALVPLLVLASGCSGSGDPKYVAVSGKVHLNGKPLAGATVQFNPVSSDKNKSPGKTSAGSTDSEGKFTLFYDVNKNGAVVGEHKVMIYMMPDEAPAPFDPELGSPDGYVPPKSKSSKPAIIIPPEYNEKTTLTFTVPPGGTSEAFFDLKMKTPAKK
jgi:hypothetical protein